MATFIANGNTKVFVVRAISKYADGKVYTEDYGLRSDGAVLRRLVSARMSDASAPVTFTTGYTLTGARFSKANMAGKRVTLGVFMKYVSTRPGVTIVYVK